MAHTPGHKAAAVAAYFNGDGWDKVCADFGVSRSCLKKWIDKAKAELKENGAQGQPPKGTELKENSGNSSQTPTESRTKRFNEALETFLFSTIRMCQAWAEACSDPAFIQNNPSGVNVLGQTVLDRADRLAALVQPPNQSNAEEESAELDE